MSCWLPARDCQQMCNSLAECHLRSGRMRQLNVSPIHMMGWGGPLAGDEATRWSPSGDLREPPPTVCVPGRGLSSALPAVSGRGNKHLLFINVPPWCLVTVAKW